MKKFLVISTTLFMLYACKAETSDTEGLFGRNRRANYNYNYGTTSTTANQDSNNNDSNNDNISLDNNGDIDYAPNPEEVELSQDELEMVIAVNQYRVKNGRGILKISRRLMVGAREQSRLMRSKGQNHWLCSPNGANAENIFVSALSVKEAMYGGRNARHGFTQSPGHNANLLNASFRYIGVGNIPNLSHGYWTQRFAR